MKNATYAGYTVPMSSARNVVAAASSQTSSRGLCEAVGLDASQLGDPHCRMPMSQLIALYETAARVTKDNAFGLHVGVRTSLRAFGVFGYVVMNSATVGLAIERAVRYFPIWTNGASFSSHADGSTVRLIWQYAEDSGSECRHDCEMTLLSATKVNQLSNLGNLQPREIHFQHSPPKDTSEHRRLFKAPVYFRMQHNEVIFDRAILSARVKQADPDLCDLLIGQAEGMLAADPSRSNRSNLVDRIQYAIRQYVRSGNVGLEPLSRTVGIGTRTLQRKLKEQGTSFRELLTKVRQELAEQNLRDSELSIGEIANLLGYSNPSEFHRAFRDWTGIAPKQYRLRNGIGRTGIDQQD